MSGVGLELRDLSITAERRADGKIDVEFFDRSVGEGAFLDGVSERDLEHIADFLRDDVKNTSVPRRRDG